MCKFWGKKKVSPVPNWAKKLPWNLIHEKCDEFHVDPFHIGAMIQTESGGNTWAVRYEPGWSYGYDQRDYADHVGSTMFTEIELQKMSFGLCQVMGTVAREHNFKGWLTELCNPSVGIEYGCRVWRQKAERYGDSDPGKIYAAYNAGSVRYTKGEQYVNMLNVDRYMRLYRELVAIS